MKYISDFILLSCIQPSRRQKENYISGWANQVIRIKAWKIRRLELEKGL